MSKGSLRAVNLRKMILSNTEIHKALDEGRIVINPEPRPRFPQVQGPHCPYDTHSVDLTLGPVIEAPLDGAITIDLSRPGGVTDTIRRNSKTHQLSRENPFYLEPSHFVLGTTDQWIELPLQAEPDRSLAARIEGKSSRARFGLLIHFTAPTVHPNFKGNLTLEMINLGKYPFLLSPGMAIAQLIFEEVRGIPIRNDSQFQGQRDPAGVIGNGRGGK